MAEGTQTIIASLCKRALESTVGHIARSSATAIHESKPPRVGEMPLPNCVYALVSGDQLKILVKLHFSGRSKLLLQRSENAGNRSAYQNETAFREVCNVLAGRLKSELSERGLVLGQSLPVAVDALDEILNPVQVGYSDEAAWRIEAGDGVVLATFHWQVSGDDVGQALQRVGQSPTSDSSGSIELF
ncbi:MAG: hypothetical protein RIR26_1263 [Pseudomonadota bacterium]|jgi:hypothetical protein